MTRDQKAFSDHIQKLSANLVDSLAGEDVATAIGVCGVTLLALIMTQEEPERRMREYAESALASIRQHAAVLDAMNEAANSAKH